MATEEYLSDVLALVETLSQHEFARTVAQWTLEGGTPTDITVNLHVDAAEMRPAIAVQQAVQLSVEAAAIAVHHLSQPESALTREYVQMLVDDRIVELTIVGLSEGSFFARLRIDPRTRAGRARLLAIAGLAALALHWVCPPAAVAVIGMAVEAARDVNDLNGILERPAEPVEVRSVDTDAAASAPVTARVEVQQRQTFVYDVDLTVAVPANQAFVRLLHDVENVQRQTRFIVGGGPEEQRVRIFADRPVEEAAIRRAAAVSGAEIVTITEGQ